MIRNSRHIDCDTRMVWMSLRSEARAMTAGELVRYWYPTFSPAEVDDALRRLRAGKYVAAFGRAEDHFYVSDDCVPLPGFDAAAVRPAAGVPAP